MYADGRQRTIENEEKGRQRISDRDRAQAGQRGRILTNWKAVKAKARRRRSLEELAETEESRYSRNERGEGEREKERIGKERRNKPGKRRAARHSCHDEPRSGIFRAEIKWRNERTPSAWISAGRAS